MPRQQSTPTSRSFKRGSGSEVGSRLQYGSGAFVRGRTQEYEERVDFFRIASETSMGVEAGEHQQGSAQRELRV